MTYYPVSFGPSLPLSYLLCTFTYTKSLFGYKGRNIFLEFFKAFPTVKNYIFLIEKLLKILKTYIQTSS